MELTDKKFEYAIFALVAVLIGGLGYLFKSPVQTALNNAELVYEMPRPKSFLAALFGFGLEDREIDRKYVNPFDKKKEEAKKAADAKSPAAPAAKVAQKKTEEKKKTDDAKKPKVEMNVVNAEKHAMTADDIQGGGHNGGLAANNANTADAQNNNTGADKGKDGTMSLAQWRALISGQPTKENVAKLVAAYMTKDVDETTFYTIMSDLLRNNKSETQALGLYAASTVYTAQSFNLVASNYEQLSSDNQTKARSYMMSYGTSGHTGVLSTVLKGNNAEAVEFAIQVVIKGYQDAKANPTTTPTDPRNSRGDVHTSGLNNVASYTQFVSIFQQLSQSSDQAIRELAASALSQIQTVAAL